jgi:hypothetical protein
MMQISIIPPNIRTITHWVSDVNIPINPISRKCANKQIKTNLIIRFFSHSKDNVVNRDNHLVEDWIKGGYLVEIIRHYHKVI